MPIFIKKGVYSMEQMNFFNFIQQLFTCLLLPVTGYICKQFLSYINGQKQNTYLSILYEEITRAVKAVYETQVKDIKSTNQWTPSKQKEVKALAKTKTLQALSISAYRCLRAANPQLEDYIDSLIETILYDLKNTSGKI